MEGMRAVGRGVGTTDKSGPLTSLPGTGGASFRRGSGPSERTAGMQAVARQRREATLEGVVAGCELGRGKPGMVHSKGPWSRTGTWLDRGLGTN